MLDVICFMVKKVGIFSFTCCEGCVVVFIEALNSKYDEWMKKIKIENFRALKKVKPVRELDIALIEGAISTESEIKRLKEIRSKSKIVVAFGSGAVNGYPSNQRNKFGVRKKGEIAELVRRMGQIEEIMPISKFVKVDVEIPGCPVDERVLIERLEGLM